MDETFERILVDLDTDRSSVFTMGKLGILWELDRKTGAFVSARDLRLPEPARRRSEDRKGDLSPQHDSAGRASSC